MAIRGEYSNGAIITTRHFGQLSSASESLNFDHLSRPRRLGSVAQILSAHPLFMLVPSDCSLSDTKLHSDVSSHLLIPAAALARPGHTGPPRTGVAQADPAG